MGALSDLIEAEFGGAFSVEVTETQVQTTAGLIIGNNPESLGMVMVNLGANDVYVAPGPDVSSNAGIFLSASGGSLALTARDDLVLVGHEWYGVSETTFSNFYILRVVRYRSGK